MYFMIIEGLFKYKADMKLVVKQLELKRKHKGSYLKALINSCIQGKYQFVVPPPLHYCPRIYQCNNISMIHHKKMS